jgi:nucleoside-diphosphate-sugar epimerase
MKVLVTGATGFLGNHVVEKISMNNSIELITNSLTNKCNISSKHIFHRIKESDSNLYEKFYCPDRLIHLAWEGLPNYMEDFHIRENLPNNIHFLKNLIDNGLKNLTVIGTCFEYGLQEGCLDEQLPCNPCNYYALAKDSLRRYLEIYCNERNVNFKWLRLFYVYGRGQNPNSLLSQLEKAIGNKELIFNMSGGEQFRDYLPADKMAEYIVKVALQDKVTGPINICSGKPLKLSSFVREIIKQRNEKIELNLGYYPYSKLESMKFWGDNNKLKEICNLA